MTHVFAYL